MKKVVKKSQQQILAEEQEKQKNIIERARKAREDAQNKMVQELYGQKKSVTIVQNMQEKEITEETPVKYGILVSQTMLKQLRDSLVNYYEYEQENIIMFENLEQEKNQTFDSPVIPFKHEIMHNIETTLAKMKPIDTLFIYLDNTEENRYVPFDNHSYGAIKSHKFLNDEKVNGKNIILLTNLRFEHKLTKLSADPESLAHVLNVVAQLKTLDHEPRNWHELYLLTATTSITKVKHLPTKYENSVFYV
jgi:hypothetical protein